MAALDLWHVPARAASCRSQALPDGISIVLEIAAGDTAARSEAAGMTGRPEDVIQSAATFYIEQVLLAADNDSYRMLGSASNSDSAELRRNMALLMRWSHPDSGLSGDAAIYTRRIGKAWEDLKSEARRANYDAAQRTNSVVGARSKSKATTAKRRRWLSKGADARREALSMRTVVPRRLGVPGYLRLKFRSLLERLK